MLQKFKPWIEVLRRDQSRKWLWIGFSTLLVGVFLVLSSEVREYGQGKPELIGRMDESFLNFLVGLRNPRLNGIMVDITALGSFTDITLLIVAFLVYLVITKKSARTAYLMAHLVLAGAGASILTWLLKGYFERSRPDILQRLVEVEGFSYPSGHSLGSAAVYFTMAVICSRFIQGRGKRAVCILLFSFLIIMIGVSRMYLGVHYFSDVTAGICLGIAWASLLSSALAFIYERF